MEAQVEEAMDGSLLPAGPRVLIADDQADVIDALDLLLKREGYQIERASSPAAVLERLGERPFDAVLMDLNYARDTTSGEEGLDLIARIRALDPTLPVLVMTAWSSVPLAVEAMRRGVRDFLQKPWENARVVAMLRDEIDRARAERDRQRRDAFELEDAERTGRSLLPGSLPQVVGYELAGRWRPARAVGGDYFNTVKFSEDRLGIAIGDVSGKGMAAALLMSNVQAAFRACVSRDVAPRDLCARLNAVVGENIARDKFISFFYAHLDAARRRLLYTNAGHNPPVRVTAAGETRRLEAGGPVLGIIPDADYEQGEEELVPGDVLVLFTDGLTESRNAAGEEFGEERLAALVWECRQLDAEAIRAQVFKSVEQFGAFEDDATALVVKGVPIAE